MSSRKRSNEFSLATKQAALARQKNRCASCGTHFHELGDASKEQHEYGEGVKAHHIQHVKSGGSNTVDNCAIICDSCHYCVHEGGNFRFGTVGGQQDDFPHFNG